MRHFFAVTLFVFIPLVVALKSGDWKSCSQSGFCRRGRAIAERAANADPSNTWKSPYSVDPGSVVVDSDQASFTAHVHSALYPTVIFTLDVRVHEDGVVRVRMDELNGLRKRYDEAASWALVREPTISKDIRWTATKDAVRITYGHKTDIEVVVDYNPLKVTLLRDGAEEIVINGRGLLHMEHFRTKESVSPPSEGEQVPLQVNTAAWFEGDSQDAWWEEKFNTWTDSKPKGPESLSIDITFPNHAHVYGIPQHAAPLSLPHTTGPSFDPSVTRREPPSDLPAPPYNEPYRLYNADVFEYLPSSPMSLYGSIPLMLAHTTRGSSGTIGVFSAVGSETWVDVGAWIDGKSKGKGQNAHDIGTTTHWISESGILDLFLLPGPRALSPAVSAAPSSSSSSPASPPSSSSLSSPSLPAMSKYSSVFAQYAGLTGTTPLPPLWALAYHQCRWNYVSENDVLSVQDRFDALSSGDIDMPVDVFWLDIEYAEEHMYMMWDKKNFPHPKEMMKALDERGRKLVAIVDPHLKRSASYPVYMRASDLGVLVQTKGSDDGHQLHGGGEYEGWCWSGSSSWMDFFNPGSWEFWKSLFKLGPQVDGKAEGWRWLDSAENVFIWNDMNEPSVFNGPEITMPKDNMHYGGWEHRDVHNINGMLFANLTSQALTTRSDTPKRPFVLTRSFFAGSQRFGAMWTGDNMGTWEHMTVNVKMVLANGLGGMIFAGSDVGGFFGNPSPEMLVRWYAVGIFSPFFRAHAHLDTKRREPYLLDEPYRSIVRDMLKLRYAMLPMWYTAFREATVEGGPLLIPQWVMFPKDEAGLAIDDQYYIGSSGLLFKPVTAPDVTEVQIYLAEDENYYNYFTHHVYRPAVPKLKSGAHSGSYVTVPAGLSEIPLLQRGGSIVSTRERPRRSSPLMKRDPFTLYIALDRRGNARGELYFDDGESFAYRQGQLVWREWEALTYKRAGKRFMRLSSKDLARRKPESAIDDSPVPGLQGQDAEVGVYDPNNAFAKSVKNVRVERIVLVGIGVEPKDVWEGGEDDNGVGGRRLLWDYTPGLHWADKKDGGAGVLIIKDPAVGITSDWSITIAL